MTRCSRYGRNIRCTYSARLDPGHRRARFNVNGVRITSTFVFAPGSMNDAPFAQVEWKVEILLAQIECRSIGAIELDEHPVRPELPDRARQPTGSECSPESPRRYLVDADSRNGTELVVEALRRSWCISRLSAIVGSDNRVLARVADARSPYRLTVRAGENVFAANPFICQIAEAEVRVEAGEPVEVRAHNFLVEQHSSDVGVGEHVAAQPQGR